MARQGVQLTAKQQDELREAFIIYDNDGDDRINKEQACCVIRCVGLAPTNEDLNRMLGDRDKLFTLQDIQSIIATKAPAPESEQSLQDALRLFDKFGGNCVDTKEFHHVVTTLGEKLKDEEVDILIRDLDISAENQFNIDDFVHTVRGVLH